MSHKDDIKTILMENPNRWFSTIELCVISDSPPENMSKFMKQILKWNDNFELKSENNKRRGNKYINYYRYVKE